MDVAAGIFVEFGGVNNLEHGVAENGHPPHVKGVRNGYLVVRHVAWFHIGDVRVVGGKWDWECGR